MADQDNALRILDDVSRGNELATAEVAALYSDVTVPDRIEHTLDHILDEARQLHETAVVPEMPAGAFPADHEPAANEPRDPEGDFVPSPIALRMIGLYGILQGMRGDIERLRAELCGQRGNGQPASDEVHLPAADEEHHPPMVAAVCDQDGSDELDDQWMEDMDDGCLDRHSDGQ